MQTDRYQPLRDAIAAGPTPGPWFAVNDGTEDEPMMSVKAARIAGQKPRHVVAICATGDSPQRMEDANAALIAAADPDTIAKLLKERDALREALQGMVRYVGIPTVLQDRPEFKAARAALADGEEA